MLIILSDLHLNAARRETLSPEAFALFADRLKNWRLLLLAK